MSTPTSKSLYPLLGIALLLAILNAGCTGPQYGQPPVTTQATPAATSPPVTPVVTTTMTTIATATTPAPTIPPTTATAAPITTVPPPPVSVIIQGFAFSPASVTVPRGTTVTWTNRDPASHTIVNDGTSMFGAGQKFSSTPIGSGQSFSFTFTEAGTYPYHCGIHTTMHGTIIVT